VPLHHEISSAKRLFERAGVSTTRKEPAILISGYRVGQPLSRTFADLRRGWRETDERPVLILESAGREDDDAAARLRRELQLLSTLGGVRGVAQPLEVDETTGAMVLDDPGHVPLGTLVAEHPMPVEDFLAVAVGLTTTVGEMHRRGVVHGSLGPATILVHPGTRDTLVLDFSRAARVGEVVRSSDHEASPRCVAYGAPERTGRTSCIVDPRSDLYSLGVLFFELLSGRTPFSSEDALEVVHGHFARTPPRLEVFVEGLPTPVADIVARLLEKNTEERYQSGWGLADDLTTCAREWAATGAIASFPLGRTDVSDRLTIPRRLYGRDAELASLLAVFERVCRGGVQVALLSGQPGAGKTALALAIHRAVTLSGGRFVSGKFDLLERNTPYGALIPALRGLLVQVLAESEERLEEVRARLGSVLGGNGGLIAGLVPELELLTGPQPAAPQVRASEADKLLKFAFESLVEALATREQPLVVFIDDLQWADAATLSLLAHVLTTPAIDHLLVVGAYRDGEVVAPHPLLDALARLEVHGTQVETIPVAPLRRTDLVRLTAEALRAPATDVEDLAELVLTKTDGNPFFVGQFLTQLYADGLLAFDHATRRWTYDLRRIEAVRITANVAELRVRKLHGLDAGLRETLALAACLGARFRLGDLSIACARAVPEVGRDAWEAVGVGLLVPVDAVSPPDSLTAEETQSFQFLHDRVQQAAYSLIPPSETRAVHLRVGRLLLAAYGPEVPADRLFDVVDHLNAGLGLIEDEAERTRLVALDLRAGKEARAKAAFQSALGYARSGLSLLPEERWSCAYERTFELSMLEAQCAYLCGDFDAAERGLEALVARARSPLEKAEVYRQKIVISESLARHAQARQAGLVALELLGVRFPTEPAEQRTELAQQLEAIRGLLGDRRIAELESLPVMADAGSSMAIALMAEAWSSVYIDGHEMLAFLFSAMIVRLSLAYGNTEDSAYGYVTHAVAVGPVGGDYRAAYEWGSLGLRVNELFKDHRNKAKIHQQFNAHVTLWCRPLETCMAHAREACKAGLESGDFNYAGYGAFTETWAALVANRDLAEFVHDFEPTVKLLERIRIQSLADAQRLFLGWARALLGETAGPHSVDHGDFDAREYEEVHGENRFCLTFLLFARLHLGVLFEDHAAAASAAARIRAEGWVPDGTIWPVLFEFWEGLAVAQRAAGEDERASARTRLAAARRVLEGLVDACPENYRCFLLLLGAEDARLAGDLGASVLACEEALAYARETENVQMEALAAELCGRAWVARGREPIAAACLREARQAYARWGAAAKVRSLEQRYGNLLETRGATGVSSELPRSLDHASLLKAARVVAAEIELDTLLEALVRLSIENAGAERGMMIQERSGRLFVVAEGSAASNEVDLCEVPLDERHDLSRSIVRLVHRTGRHVLTRGGNREQPVVDDAYAARGQLSILCTPIVHQGRRAGLFYFENGAVQNAFPPERIEMIQVLSAQAAIALENARLYGEMRGEIDRRKRAERDLQRTLDELRGLKDRLQQENVYLQEEIQTRHNFEEIVGESEALVGALRRIEQVSDTESTVLLLGETGVGKELFARAIHARSSRRGRPLVKVNCGAIPAGLVESELFGHLKGAFTGALHDRVGRFELANGGAIFLDEVGELPLDTQVLLLRVLQEREFEPVGSSKTVRVDVRIIAATNRDLGLAVKEGRFRADLLYRLNVFPIRVPPLRERAEDVPLLTSFFLTGLSQRLGKPLEGFSRRAMQRLKEYDWPGNVRELENVVERAAILARGPVLDLEGDPLGVTPEPVAGERSLAESERSIIIAALRRRRGVVEGPRGAAVILGLHPNTLRSRLKRLGIQRSDYEQS